MDAKIKELLTRLSFFAEDGMADKPIVEIAKQADALLYELVKQRNARQPMAWAVLRDGEVWRVSRFEPTKMGEVGGAVFVPLYTAPPVPRDVLMAFGDDVQQACAVSCIESNGAVPYVDLSAIADLYASKVQTEPVNQQLLAAMTAVNDKFKSRPYGTGSYITKDVRNMVAAAIAAAEAAQPVAMPDDIARAIECAQDMWNQLIRVEKLQPVFVTQQDMRRWSAALSVLEAMASQQPASAQPVAVPAILEDIAYLADGARVARSDGNFGDESEWLRKLYDRVGELDWPLTKVKPVAAPKIDESNG